MIALVWVGSIVATIVIADRKNLNMIGFLFLSLFFGPLALLIVCLWPSQPKKNDPAAAVGKLTPQEARQQLLSVKDSLKYLLARVERIEAALAKEDAVHPVIYPNHASIDDPLPEVQKVSKPAVGSPQETMEVIFGKYWLNRIGVVLFVIGIGLFINYTFQYFPAWIKIAIGYAIAVLFLFWGHKM